MARRRRMLAPTPRRKRVWADTYFEDLGFAENALRSQDLLSDYVASGGSTQGVTVVRTVVQLLWGINESHGPGDRITFGLIKGTQTAADVADPVAEPYADWAWNECRYSGWEHGLVTADASEKWVLDTKSMRRIDEVGETWWLIYQGTAPVTTTATYDVRCHARTLLLLP